MERLTEKFVSSKTEGTGRGSRLHRWGRQKLTATKRTLIATTGTVALFALAMLAVREKPYFSFAILLLEAAILWFATLGIEGDSQWFRIVNRIAGEIGIWNWRVCYAVACLLWIFSIVSAAANQLAIGLTTYIQGFAFYFFITMVAPSPVSLDRGSGRLFHATAHDTTARAALLAALLMAPALCVRAEKITSNVAISSTIALVGLFGVGLMRSLKRRRVVLTRTAEAADRVIVESLRPTFDAAAYASSCLELDRAFRTGLTSNAPLLGLAVSDSRTRDSHLAYANRITAIVPMFKSEDKVVGLLHEELRSETRTTLLEEHLEFIRDVRAVCQQRIDISN